VGEKADGQKEVRSGWRHAFLAGVRSPPLRGGASLGRMALRGKGRIWREGRFSRRDAVSAPAGYGRTNAVAFHSQYMP